MTKRICIISLGNIYLSPYIHTYTKLIKSHFSVIYWDRENINEELPNSSIFRFRRKLTGKFSKLFSYFCFRKYIIKILKKEKFDCLIFLQTLGSVLVGSYITRKYRNKYIVDIRDYSYEGNRFVNRKEKRVIANALKCVISSEGYKSFLPSGDYLVTHNRRELDELKVGTIKRRAKNRMVINIAFIGYVNYQEQHKALLLSLKNDSRFVVSFIGTRANELEKFCLDNDIKNAVLRDRFDPSNILDLYSNVDFINNLYGNHTPTLDFALSNKLYFAAELNIPILVYEDTFMSAVSSKYKIGLTIDKIDNSTANKIWDYYHKIDWQSFADGCSLFLEKVKEDQSQFDSQISILVN